MTDYATEFFNYLDKTGSRTFTHKDILNNTTANCSYTVIRSLKGILKKKNLILSEIWDEHINQNNEKKKFKKYFIEDFA